MFCVCKDSCLNKYWCVWAQWVRSHAIHWRTCIWSMTTSRIGFWTWIWSWRDWTSAGIGLLISMLKKLNWFHLTGQIALVLLMWEWMGLFLWENHLLRCWGWLALLNWIGGLALSLLLKPLPTRKLEFWFVL